ncbi:MAG: ribosome small subunit-dependent GTPase A [Spirochaetaceae bacterium]|jgi:ribosome biogenesis GTPase|nr:ribosome small subunit-dependent GTPase A [Spirochaetaceae bacterium]
MRKILSDTCIITNAPVPRSGLVLCGSMNVFTVKCDDDSVLYQCSIKGKVLKLNKCCYNPLCPGDAVRFLVHENNSASGQIIAMKERRSLFSRYNEKGRKPQMLAANIDRVFIIASLAHPPFRPRFIDRVLVQCEKAHLEAFIVINKMDLAHLLPPEDLYLAEERLAGYAAMGYPVLQVSAMSGTGLPALEAALDGIVCVFAGQSGAGKSSLINALLGRPAQKTGELALKYDRGAHTTVMALMLESGMDRPDSRRFRIIDTPGLRHFIPDGIRENDLARWMRDLAPLAGNCRFGDSCTHTAEPGCALIAAFESGAINPDRWDSFIALRNTLARLVSNNAF